MASETALARLVNMGFKLAGAWSLDGDGLRLSFVDHGSARNILYAFVAGGAVMYVGKTTQTLAKRLYGYARPGPTQSTNIKGNRLIREALASGQLLEVFALPDNGLLYYGGFHVNLAAGLEDSLVRELRPPWNVAGMAPD